MTFNTAPLANILGLVSLILYILTLLPSTMKVVFSETKKSGIYRVLLKNRRLMGIAAFVLAMAHGVLLFWQYNPDIWDSQTYVIYLQGIVLTVIFTLLAVTSNRWSMKKLKKNWKKLHQLTYLAMFVLTWHVADKMFGHWTYLTPIGIMGMTAISFLFLVRKGIEYRKKASKNSAKLNFE